MRATIFLFIALIVSPALAAEGARGRLDAFAKGLNSLSGGFEQTLVDGNGRSKASRGTLALKAPRQFRWDTAAPFKQIIVADGDKVWVYDPDLEQVTVRAQGTEEAHSPLTVLTDLAQLDRDFTSSEQGERAGLVWLRLKSKEKEPQFEFADLGFDAEGLARMEFTDGFGNRTEIRFSAWQRNAKLSADTFRFSPPKGVDVIGDPTPAAEVHPLKQ
ncbi:MAG: outer membrane lipoprotein chaperone LolA [Rudaea sp.]